MCPPGSDCPFPVTSLGPPLGPPTVAKSDAANLKKDDGKLRLDLVPPEAMFALAEVFAFGATKYAEFGWEEGGLSAKRLYAAALRHLTAYWQAHRLDDEDGQLDPESGLPHLYHALACISMLVTLAERGLLGDD